VAVHALIAGRGGAGAEGVGAGAGGSRMGGRAHRERFFFPARPLSSHPHPPPLPSSPEFNKIASKTALGFVVMGFIGFFVKLIFIPINQIIVGGSVAKD
jgi:hypothetical protein